MVYIPKTPIARAMMERRLAQEAAAAEAAASGREERSGPTKSVRAEPVEALSFSSKSATLRQAQGEREGDNDTQSNNLPAPLPLAGPHGEGHTIFTPLAQGVFLECLAEWGNVRLACRKAGVSPQTAYRARRRSAGFARAWDTARVSARTHAEEALEDRALNGWEEPVFYHGEEIARRRRFSDRLLLAHLARLDRLAEREDVGANMAMLDEQIEALKRGEDLVEVLTPTPLTLSLLEAKLARRANGRSSLPARGQKKVRCFDKLSMNGVLVGRAAQILIFRTVFHVFHPVGIAEGVAMIRERNWGRRIASGSATGSSGCTPRGLAMRSSRTSRRAKWNSSSASGLSISST